MSWAAKLSTLFLAFSLCACNESQVKISGTVTNLDSRKPISGATIRVLNSVIPSDPMMLPKHLEIERAVTDSAGHYSVSVSRQAGLMIELVGENCKWWSYRIPIDDRKARAEVLSVDIKTRTKDCD